MKKIATHDSATGERSMWYCIPLIPFARTQSKTIKQQYEAGCRSFDIRIRKHRGIWKCAHGLWVSKRDAVSIFRELNQFDDRCQVCITYEGTSKHNNEFLEFVSNIKDTFTRIIYGSIAVKYGSFEGTAFSYTTLIHSEEGYEGGAQGFIPLNGSTWHSLIPIPWLWDKLCSQPHWFNNNKFIYVDFL